MSRAGGAGRRNRDAPTVERHVSRRRVPPARLPRRRDAHGRSRGAGLDAPRHGGGEVPVRRRARHAAGPMVVPAEADSGGRRRPFANGIRRIGTPWVTSRHDDRRLTDARASGEDRDARRRRPRRTFRCRPSPDVDVAYCVHVRGRRRGRVRPAHRQSRRARRAPGVDLRRDVAAADVRRHEDRADGRRRRRRSCRQGRRGRARDGVARPRAVGADATSGSRSRIDWERREIPPGSGRCGRPPARRRCRFPCARAAATSCARSHATRTAGRRAPRSTSTRSGRACRRGAAKGNRIELTPERKTWKPGETARILIQSPWPRATALVTIEREGIRSHRTFTITSTQDTVDVPITEADVPNVYVSVLLVKGRTSTELAARRHRPRAALVPGRLHGADRRRLVEAAARGRVRRPRGVPAAPAGDGVGRRGRARRDARARAKSRSGRWTTGCCRSPTTRRPTC